MQKLSNKTAKALHSAMVTYGAFREARANNDENGIRVWGGIIRDERATFRAIGFDVGAICAMVEARIERETADKHTARRMQGD